MSQPLINILIRHKEGRTDQLEKCLKSIWQGEYDNCNLIVSIEGLKQKQDKWDNERLIFLPVPSEQHFNLHCNDLKAEVKDGWFFFMDDDDYLASPTVLEELSHHLFEGALIVQFLRKNNRHTIGHDVIKPTYMQIAQKQIKKGMIGGGCIVLHHSFKDVADWLPHAGADYDWIKAVTDKVPTRFVPLVLQIAENKSNGL